MVIEHTALVRELEGLVEQTFQLWDEIWVGFTWRNYTFEHVQRVRALAATLAAREGGDPLLLDYAGLLHDITKGYDGEIIMAADGQRRLDANGFWQNAFLIPARENEVTRLYNTLGLSGTLHNDSGADVAAALLRRRGVPEAFVAEVTALIRAHLHGRLDARVEERVLYDADTIDANVGLPALLRNLYINLHREEERQTHAGEDFVGWVDGRRADFYRWWLGDKVASWITSRRQMFLDRMTTPTALALATERYDRLWAWVTRFLADLDGDAVGPSLGPLDLFIASRENPAVSALAIAAGERWTTGEAGRFVADLQLELSGQR
ncbi:MAG: HD domain-containing protein [Chloroflexota bacterium]